MKIDDMPITMRCMPHMLKNGAYSRLFGGRRFTDVGVRLRHANTGQAGD